MNKLVGLNFSEREWVRILVGLFGLCACLHLIQIVTQTWAYAYPDTFTFIAPFRDASLGGLFGGNLRRTLGYIFYLKPFSVLPFAWYFAIVGQHLITLAVHGFLIYALFGYFRRHSFPMPLLFFVAALILLNDKVYFYDHSLLSDSFGVRLMELTLGLFLFERKDWIVRSVIILTVAYTVLARPQVMVFYLPLVGLSVLIPRWRLFGGLLIAAIATMYFVNAKTTSIAGTFGLLGASAVAPLMQLDSGVELGVKKAISPVILKYRAEYARQDGNYDAIDHVYYKAYPLAEEFYKSRGAADPAWEINRAFKTVAIETYRENPVAIFRFHIRKMWNGWFHMSNVLDSDPHTTSTVPARYWAGEGYAPSTWSWRGKGIDIAPPVKLFWKMTATLIRILSLNPIKRFIQMGFLISLIPGTVLFFVQWKRREEYFLVAATSLGAVLTVW